MTRTRLTPLLFAVGTAVALVVVLGAHNRTGPETPLVAYDWPAFTENRRLSEDFTRAVQEVFEPGHTESNPHWLAMKQELFAELEYLGFQQLRIDLLQGFKHRRYVGFTVTRADGSVVRSSSTASERYRFPMVVEFKPGRTLVIKTNGLEKNFDYGQSKEDLKLQFTWLLYTALADQFQTTPRFREREAQKVRAAQEAEAARLEQARKSWE